MRGPKAEGRSLRVATALRGMIVLLFLAAAHTALACTVCMGAPDDPMTQGVSRGVWVLLAVIFAVQALFVALFVSFWRRARDLKKFREQFRVVGGSSR